MGMTLRVIGAGFGRTGTDSMREALNVLGFGPCHHIFEVTAHPEQKRLWRAMVAGAAPDWKRLFEGYASCVDLPAAWFWRTLIAVYPDARVVLTLRDSESWWRSFEPIARTVLTASDDPDSLAVTLVANRIFGGRPLDRAHAVAVYEAHNAAVLATVPADRLLVHRLGDGWEPLCAHLGVPVPEQPYPRRNAASEFRANLDRHLEAGRAAEAGTAAP
jgi:Sulfotransferase domain